MQSIGADTESGGGEPPAKRAKGVIGGGAKGGGGQQEDKTNPIPRTLSSQSVTLHFTQRTWEEIGPGELKYSPLSLTPYYMMDPAMLNQFLNFKHLWYTMQIHQPKMRISNLIMLQDELVNQGGTPMETTAFTQVCYLMLYQPTRMTEYFQLGNITDCKTAAYEKLSYNFSEVECTDKITQLVNLQGYTDFERLCIRPACINKYAGTVPNKDINRDSKTGIITDTYISPSILFPITHPLHGFSANLQPVDPPLIENLNNITWAKNLDKITFHKYGDVVEIPIVTNLEGKHLLNDFHNDFTNRGVEVQKTTSEDKDNYYTEFAWPSPNRPYRSRHDNLANLDAMKNVKDLKNLHHNFLTMPPIRKANGALLKQRCSFLLEQSFSVTFNFIESIYYQENNEKNFLHQKDGIIIRPLIYGNTTPEAPPVGEGAICQYGFKCTSKAVNCPTGNDFADLDKFLDNRTLWGNSEIDILNVTEGSASSPDYIIEITLTKFDGDSGLQKLWKDRISGSTSKSIVMQCNRG